MALTATESQPTSLFRLRGSKHGHEAISRYVGIRDHLYHHLVATGHQGSRSEGATEATKALATSVAIVHIHKVIATQVVTLQIYESESENDHFPDRDLPNREKSVRKTASLVFP